MNTSKGCGVIASYVHPDARFGAMVEISCRSRVATLSPELRTLAHELAMQVAATDPQVLRREDLSADMLAVFAARLQEGQRLIGRAEPQARQVVAARLKRYHEQACLLEQKCIQDPALTIRERLDAASRALREPLAVVRFIRFATGRCVAGGRS
jgi:elongation factor Ts